MNLVHILFVMHPPPPSVFLRVGLGLQFWIKILLTRLGYDPGGAHAV